MINYIEKINWLNEFPKDGNNDGYIYGINYLDFEGEGDILDCEWFRTEEERENAIKNLKNAKVINSIN